MLFSWSSIWAITPSSRRSMGKRKKDSWVTQNLLKNALPWVWLQVIIYLNRRETAWFYIICSKKCPSSQSGSAANLQINTIRECVLEILGPWVKLLNRAACDLQPPQQAKTTQLAKTRRLSTHWGRWAQHAADYSKGLFYYPEPSELWAKLGNKIPNASQTKIQQRGFIQGCYGVNQHVGRVVITALPLNHFHWFIGHDIVIRNLLHLFPGHILVSQFESSKLP